MAADNHSTTAAGVLHDLLDVFRLRKPLIPLTHVDAASGAAAVSGLWGELFMLKALLVFESGVRLSSSGHGHNGYHKQSQSRRHRQQSRAALQAGAALEAQDKEGSYRTQVWLLLRCASHAMSYAVFYQVSR